MYMLFKSVFIDVLITFFKQTGQPPCSCLVILVCDHIGFGVVELLHNQFQP